MKNLLKKVLSVAAATALLMTSVVSASAADPDADKKYTITITQPTDKDVNTENLPDNLYAFQILSGTVPDNTVEGDYVNPGTNGTSLPITDIKWGSGINTALLGDLIETLSESTHIGHYFSALKAASDDGAGNDELALLFAEAISVDGFGTRQNMQYLADILGGFKAEGSAATTNYLTSTSTTMTKDTSDGVKWTATVPAGYYLIKSGEEDDDVDSAYSARMLFVASNITQRLKESVPFFHKYIVREDVDDDTVTTDLSGTDVAGVGDIVNFQLKGTLPTNYDKYVIYKYEFNDTVSDGLDVVDYTSETENDNPTVLVKVQGLFKNVTDSITDPVTQKAEYDYTTENNDIISYWKWDSDIVVTIPAANYSTSWSTSGNNFSVKFSDLKSITLNVTDQGDKNGAYKLGFLFDTPDVPDHVHDGDIDEEHSSKIMVNYKAKVNEKAVVGSTGNTNTASLTYSNNPQNEEDTGTSTEDTANVYVFGLDISKYDAGSFQKVGDYEDALKLAGTEFAVTREDTDEDDKDEIAVFKLIEDDGNGLTGKHYQLQKWLPLADTDPYKASSYSLGADEVINITTFEAPLLGKLLISGLDVGVAYTFTETKAPGDPGDYATIEPFTITLTAEEVADEYTGNLSKAETDKAVDTDNPLSFEHYVTILQPTTSATVDGTAEIAVANFKYTDLPSTGGIGVYIYYIAGGCVVALALVLFALSKKKKATK